MKQDSLLDIQKIESELKEDIYPEIRQKFIEENAQERLELENKKTKEGIKNFFQLRCLKWCLAFVVLAIAVTYFYFNYHLINQNGHYNLQNHLPFISDKVMMTFLGATTIHVIALLFMLIKVIFQDEPIK